MRTEKKEVWYFIQAEWNGKNRTTPPTNKLDYARRSKREFIDHDKKINREGAVYTIKERTITTITEERVIE